MHLRAINKRQNKKKRIINIWNSCKLNCDCKILMMWVFGQRTWQGGETIALNDLYQSSWFYGLTVRIRRPCQWLLSKETERMGTSDVGDNKEYQSRIRKHMRILNGGLMYMLYKIYIHHSILINRSKSRSISRISEIIDATDLSTKIKIKPIERNGWYCICPNLYV